MSLMLSEAQNLCYEDHNLNWASFSQVVFFPSYRYMEEVVTSWASGKILEQLTKHKLLFIETQVWNLADASRSEGS